MLTKRTLLCCALLALSAPVFAKKDGESRAGMKNAVILVIRHAEKPDKGDDLSPAGQARAQAYVDYFRNFTVEAKPLKLDYLYAAADSRHSERSNQTVQPLSKALGLGIDAQFDETKFQKLAEAIRRKPPGGQYLICWHHGEIPRLVNALGAKPGALFPRGKWPDDVFGWVVQLRYDSRGHLIDAKRIDENLNIR